MTQPRVLGDRYELDGVVGRGGMAEVYRARDVRLDRVVAIKTLRSDLARDPTFQARFRREAQSAASLNHPSIIAVYDTGEDMVNDTAVPYIVMEYVDGRTLRDLLRADRRLMPERALEIVDGILRALDYSHRGGIVHRDIKPANVMLTRAGDVKVMDFGIARAVADSAATMTQTAQVIGTAQYLSPEQARGERVDARSDLYSTGCVLYELLTGQPPFTGDSPVAIAYQHVKEDPVPPSQVDPEIPRWADAIVLKAMAKDAGERYQSAGEMRADIQRALQGMPVEAQQTMAFQGTRQMTAQAPAAQSTTALPAYQYGPADGGPPTSAGGGRGRRRSSGGNGWKTALWILIPLLIIAAFAGVGWYVLSSNNTTAEKVKVPPVLEMKQSEAEKALKDAGLVPQVKEQPNNEYEKGIVFDSDPKVTTQVEKGSTVTLLVSAGKKQVEVPSGIVGSTRDEAKSKLEGLGFNVSTKTQASSKPEGEVLKVSPREGKKVDEGSTVTITVSGGQPKVPDVVGLTKDQAIEQLEGAKFKVAVREMPSDKDPGIVFRQTPSGGRELAPNSTVVIYVSTGPQATEPPPTTDEPFPPTQPPTTEQPPEDGEGNDGFGLNEFGLNRKN
ncbi:Stk1 family PASTA domain-containing Ser/Thr kinase [Bailinhaonella thermotolerans]|uniref:non-specific serine/threonine protein kinase n=1 Tax=Bailinhaonella thermotolerans TaxID=1070861 RepID=A0A3A4AXZ7_9ACTN|nr:Stk1 family PASTA domain-containing Ser/Thr kinase [Bailinhaonella thermotolerans]RJL32284.1 Stk1 family PASTA domain-containing Ser/Thr kinase [Bailinhaonella thermotolerans]